MKRAIVIGKFYPPHKGHSFLINYAVEHADEVTVLVCDNPDYKISAEVRKKLLETMHPKATVRIIFDIGLDDDSEAWAKHTIDFLGYVPDVVFSSEDYGITYAQCMGCEHVMVDPNRTHVPISATRVRTNLFKEWDFLNEPVKAQLAIRVAVVGAESTGTTTLSEALAKKFKAPWVPEFGRLYSEAIKHARHEWIDSEFTHIAGVQQAFERQAAIGSRGLVICDTNAFATTLWQERYMGHITADVQAIADNDLVDLYILTGDEIPFVQDGIRDGEHIRHAMHQRFLEELKKKDVPFIVVTGSKQERLKTASKAIDELLTQGAFWQSAKHLSRVA